jgi:hypothetical protein
MGKAKRCRSVVLGASVAAASAVGACPTANATNAQGAREQRPHEPAKVRRHDPKRRVRQRHRKNSSPAAAHPGKYVYEVVIGNTEAEENKPNMACSGSSVRITGLATFPESSNATALWYKPPESWKRLFTITTGPATTITVGWTPPSERQAAAEDAAAHNGFILNPRLWGQEDTTATSTVCDASPGAVLGELGEALATWVLPAPVRSAAALMATPPTNIYPNEYSIPFEVLPDGTVPPFQSYSLTN